MINKELEIKLMEEVDGKKLMEHAEYITSQDRESGSPGEKRAAEYFRSVMGELGLDVDIHYVENYISLPVFGSLTLQDGTELSSCITHSYGASTGEAGLEGKAVYVGGKKPANGQEDITGRIAVMNGLASAVPCKALENRGAAGIICITSGDYPYNMSISPIWGQPVPSTVGMLSKIPVVTVNASDGKRLLDSLDRGETCVKIVTEVSTKFRTVPVCVAELKADKPTDRFVMFGGHVDSWHKGGADNGGSNAVVLELARVFSKYKDKMNVNIRFVWWSGHSNGRYSGSNWYGDTYWEDLHDHAVANFDIDTVGTKGSNNFSHIECNKQCYALGRQVVRERTGQDPEYMRIQRNGDQSFWAHGVPTLFECLSLQPVDGQGEGTFMPGLPWYWHTTQDVFEHLGEEELRRDAQIFALAIARVVMANVYPFSYAELADEMMGNLEHYQSVASGAFDLTEVMKLVGRLKDKFLTLDREITRLNTLEQLNESDTQKAGMLNDLCMDLNRILIPVHYCKDGDLFQADLAVPIPAFPEFDQLSELASMDRNSNEFKFLERQLLRNRNRVRHFLIQAARRLENAGM